MQKQLIKTLIVTGGTVSEDLLGFLVNKNHYNYIIGADKGCESLYNLNIMPSHILGDFDSINSQILEFYRTQNIIINEYNTHKDMTDTEIALNLAINLKSTIVHIVGASGSRIDHTLANINLLKISNDNNTRSYLIDENNIVFILKPNMLHTLTLDMFPGYKNISFFSLGNSVINLKTTGLEYEIDNETLDNQNSRFVSNQIASDSFTVQYDKGLLLVVVARD